MTRDRRAPSLYARKGILKPLVAVGRAVRRTRAHGPRLGRYAPVSTMEVPQHVPDRAAVPAIDFHCHLGRWLSSTGGWMEDDTAGVVELMAECNLSAMVNLDGRWGKELEDNLERYDRAYPGRFFTFCHVDWELLQRREGPDALVKSLEQSVAMGARGLKVWKDLGQKVHARGRRIFLDDPLLEPLWNAAGEAGIPVLVHVADPKAFFLPADRRNERLEELLRYPKLRRPGGLEEYRRQLDSFEAIVGSNPLTTFVAAHGLCVENLSYVSQMLARYPNLNIDLGWTAQEMGRQPRAARSFIERHADRVLFGTDCFPLNPQSYRAYFRLLETSDDAFTYPQETVPVPCRWNLYGLDLASDILEKVYRQNARRLLEPRVSSVAAIRDVDGWDDRSGELR